MTLPSLRDSVRMACLLPLRPDASPLPLEKTEVTAQILGPLATVCVTQHFTNPLAEAAELEYLMPLPESAAIIAFELQTGGRIIQGELKESSQAQEAFAQARQEGRRAGLLESRRPNLYAVQLTHIQPGEPIMAILRYQERLSYDDGAYRFVFPMGLTPKYHNSGHPEENQGVDAPVALGWEPIGPVELSIEVDAGAAAGDPTSPSHPLVVARQDDHRFTVTLPGPALPDHDFVLRYPAAQADVALTAWCTPDKVDSTASADLAAASSIFLATLIPPALEIEAAAPDPREFVFILDRSGSMSGKPIAQARNALRACLRTLAPADRFNILLFDDRLEWYRSEPLMVNQAEVDAADAFLESVQGRGGTEIVAAIEAALSLPALSGRIRCVVFLTDGAVSSDERALERLRSLAGPAHIFTFGIGPSVNRALLQRMAQAGRGTAEFLQLDEDIEGAIIRFQDRVAFPLVTDLELACENGQIWDVYPSRLPDLYLGQPLEITGRVKPQGAAPLKLAARGRRGGETITLEVSIPAATASLPAVTRAWARARLDDLLQQEALAGQSTHRLRNEIISLALEYGLATPYTSFVAVDTAASGSTREPRLIKVSQPLPAGLSPEGFFGSPLQQVPHMPMPAAARATSAMVKDTADADGQPDWLARSPVLKSSLPGKLRDALSVRKDLPANQKTPPPNSLRQLFQPGAGVSPDLPASEPEENPLHWLARTQQLDGSWHSPDESRGPDRITADVELTAAALLAFLRRGHTTRSGSFRQQVRRAAGWLAARPASGFAAFARAAALGELAALTSSSAHRQSAASALASLPAPANRLETAARVHLTHGGPEPVEPEGLHDLDDLRLAALLNIRRPVPPALLQTTLGRAWAAALL